MKNKNSKKYDVIIKSAYKDYNTLPFVINSISYLNPQPENIYVISPDGFIPKCNYSIIPIKDIDVFPGVDRKIIKHRPNWCWSTFVALFQKFTKNDLYLDIQSDNIFVKDINLFENNKPNFFISPAHEQNHYPYFKFAKKIFNVDRVMPERQSFIIDFMMYNKKITSELMSDYDSIKELFEESAKIINNTCYPTEQDTFGNYCVDKFESEYNIKKQVQTYMYGVHYPKEWKIEDIKTKIKKVKEKYKNVLAISFHIWLSNEEQFKK